MRRWLGVILGAGAVVLAIILAGCSGAGVGTGSGTDTGTGGGGGTNSGQGGAGSGATTYLATANDGTNSVSVFTMNSGGTLSQVQNSPFSTDPTSSSGSTSQPYGVAFSPTGGYFAVANSGTNSVSVFTVSSGKVVNQVEYPIASGTVPLGVAFSPNGSYLAVADSSTSGASMSGVTMFTVGSGGALSPSGGSFFPTGTSSSSRPLAVAFSPSGAYLAVADFLAGGVTIFTVGSGGVLSPSDGSFYMIGSSSSPSYSPDSVAFSPNGAYLAVAESARNNTSDGVSIFSVGSGGTLSPSGGTFTSIGTNSHPMSVAFNPSSAYLAVANFTDNNVSVFTVGSGGALSPLKNSPFPTGSNSYPHGVAFSSDGSHLAVAVTGTGTASTSGIAVFNVGSGGGLSPADGSFYSTGKYSRPFGVAMGN